VNASLAFWLLADSIPSFRTLRLPASELQELAAERLSRLLFHVARHNPFYSQRLQDAGIEWADPLLQRDPHRVLAAMQPLSKLELRRAGERALAGGTRSPAWFSSASSGSTGEPFRVYYEPRAWARLKYLTKLRARYACGVRPADRIALLDSCPPSPARRALGGLRRWARISVLQPPDLIAEQLRSFAPDVLYGLPSALLEVGRALGEPSWPVKGVFTSGELLHNLARTNLTAAFGAPVFDVYGTSETKEIGWECRKGRMHLNTDVVHLEALDEKGRSVPPGEEGDLVATLLVNRAMPLLRYRTGDRGILLAESCSCGCAMPLLGVVTGRVSDTLTFRDGQRISPYAFTCAIERVPGLLRYQVSQLDSARVRVRAILEVAADRAAVAAQLQSALRYDVAAYIDTDVEFVDRLPTGPRAKFRVVEPLA
jgi:phenylacetate-CoA ligase